MFKKSVAAYTCAAFFVFVFGGGLNDFFRVLEFPLRDFTALLLLAQLAMRVELNRPINITLPSLCVPNSDCLEGMAS